MKYVTLSNYMSILEKENITDKYEVRLVRSIKDDYWILHLSSKEYKEVKHVVSCLDNAEMVTCENFVVNLHGAVSNMKAEVYGIKTREERNES